MQRRKFLIGLGSLAAGTAAATGTGAFSQATVNDRAVNVGVVNDSQGFLGLESDLNTLSNPEYSSMESGKLTLNFDEGAGLPENPNGFNNNDAAGVNQDSEYYFDGVFAVENNGPGEGFGESVQGVTIDDSGLDNPDHIDFYYKSNGGYTWLDGGGTVGISPGTYVSVGVRITTPENGTNDNWETGSITIEATRSTSNDNS